MKWSDFLDSIDEKRIMKIKKGDQVKIISGNDKGKQGKVIAVIPVESRIVVEGMHMKKKHMRPRKQGQKGELVRIPGPFQASQAMIICPKCSQVARVKYTINELGKKTRVCGSCASQL